MKAAGRAPNGLAVRVAMAVAVAAACADEDLVASGSAPYGVEDLLKVLEGRTLSYSMAGPETECWNHTPAGPARYEGNRALLAVWVYESAERQQEIWTSNGPAGTTVTADGLEDDLGCFDSQFWAARRGNIVVGLDRRDPDAVARGAIVVEALASLAER